MPASTAPSGSLFNTIQGKIPELLNRALTNYLPGVDPIFDVIASSERVESAGIGRNLQVKKIFQGNLAGVVQMAQPTAYQPLYGATNPSLPSQNIYRQNGGTYLPDPTKGANARPVTMTVPLQAMQATLELTLGELRADALEATIGDIVMPKLMGFVANIARSRCNMFYTTDTTDYSLCNLTNCEVGLNADASLLVFTPSNESTARFYVGQRVDLFHQTSGSGNFAQKLNVSVDADATSTTNWALDADNGTAGTTNGTISVYVVAVDEISDRVTLQLANGAWIVGAVTNATARQLPQGTPARTVKVCQAGTKYVAANGEAFSGLHTWIKGGDDATSSAASTLFGVDINRFPQFKSLTYTETGPLTEQKLRRYLSRYKAAREQYGFSIDTLLTTQGVLDAYTATKIGKEEITRTGPLSMNGEGTAPGYSFVHDGKQYTIQTSTWAAYGNMYGIKKSGFTRYVPNRTPDAGSMGDLPSFLEFEFYGPMLGFPGIRIPTVASSGGLWTDLVQMPGDMRMEVIPDQLSMLRISNLTEDKISGSYATDFLAN